jgi:hypothetical protein
MLCRNVFLGGGLWKVAGYSHGRLAKVNIGLIIVHNMPMAFAVVKITSRGGLYGYRSLFIAHTQIAWFPDLAIANVFSIAEVHNSLRLCVWGESESLPFVFFDLAEPIVRKLKL